LKASMSWSADSFAICVSYWFVDDY